MSNKRKVLIIVISIVIAIVVASAVWCMSYPKQKESIEIVDDIL